VSWRKEEEAEAMMVESTGECQAPDRIEALYKTFDRGMGKKNLG
jgi:hypothetical protein